MKEIIRDEKKFYEIKEQDLIRLHTRLRLIYECVDDIFTDYEDFDPSVIAALTDIKNQVTEARDILKVTEGHYTIKKSSVETSEDEWKKILVGAMTCGDVEQRLETVKSSLEDAISDVDCTLGDRIDELDEKIAEMYEFYENFPADWTLEKQLKELAEETVKAAIDPIVKRQTLLKMDIDSLRNDLKLWVSNDERTSAETEKRLSKLDMDMKQRIEENRTHAYIIKGFDERLKLLSKNVASIYDEVTSIKDNTTTALAADNATLARHEKEIGQLETDINLLKKALS